jgi:hypothetical protein
LIDPTKNGTTNIAKNPHIAVMMFLEMDKIHQEILFEQTYKTIWWWLRYEFAMRGSVHNHGFLKLIEPKPGIAFLTSIMK